MKRRIRYSDKTLSGRLFKKPKGRKSIVKKPTMEKKKKTFTSIFGDKKLHSLK